MSSEKIKYIYTQAKANAKDVDYIGTILIVLVVVILFGYLYISAQNKLLRLTWDDRKCNPRYLFFSGFLNSENKAPWIATDDNFKKCVAKTMYKDPKLTKEIKRNNQYIKLHDNEIQNNLSKGQSTIEDIHKQWENLKEKKDIEVQMTKSEASGIFEKQGYMHNIFAEKTSQMFQVLQSVIIYVQGMLLYKVSEHKRDLSIDTLHEYYMGKYAKTYEKYKSAFNYLDQGKWTSSMNIAREAIQEFEDLDEELQAFMGDHFYQLNDITESCYHLKYNLEDNSCEKIFPNMTKEWVDLYPIAKSIFKDILPK